MPVSTQVFYMIFGGLAWKKKEKIWPEKIFFYKIVQHIFFSKIPNVNNDIISLESYISFKKAYKSYASLIKRIQ